MRRRMTREQEQAMFAKLNEGYTKKTNRSWCNKVTNRDGSVHTSKIHTGKIGDNHTAKEKKSYWEEAKDPATGKAPIHSEVQSKRHHKLIRDVKYQMEIGYWQSVRKGASVEYEKTIPGDPHRRPYSIALNRDGPKNIHVHVWKEGHPIFHRSYDNEDDALIAVAAHMSAINTGVLV